MNAGGLALSLGILQGYHSNFTASANHFETARQHFEALGAHDRVATCDLNLGEVYRLRGNFTRAQMFFQRAHQQAEKSGDRGTMAVALTNEGQMWISMRSYERARNILLRAENLCQQPFEAEEDEDQRQDRYATLAEIYHALSTLDLIDGNPLGAWEHASFAYLAAEQAQHTMSWGLAYRAIADAITELGSVPDASFRNEPDHYYREALRCFRDARAEGDEGKTLFAHGRSHARRGKARAAAQLFKQAMVIFTRLGMTDDAARAAEAQMQVT
jgi:tetratricopeptide (TPR) repeat protein